MPDSPARPATAAEARARAAHPWIVQLPESELVVQIRKVALLELAAQGRIPDDMTTDALSSLAEALEEAREQSAEAARRTMNRRLDLVNAVAAALLVAPKMVVGGNATDDEIVPADLPLGDRIHLYGIAIGTAEGPNLAPFPGGPRADVAPVADGASLRAAAVAPAGAA